MSKRTFITNITPLPPTVSRDVVIAMLHDHHAMIALNPLVLRHQDARPPPNASPDEAERAVWYEITDRINYLPGGAVKGEVSYKACFYNLPSGLQTHVFAPAGVDIRSKWSVGGNMPGEPREPAELGLDVPKDVLYIKEEVDLRCNVLMSNFVRRNLKKSHLVVADKIIERADEIGPPPDPSSKPSGTRSLPLETALSRETSITQNSPYSSNSGIPDFPGPVHYSYPPHCACEGLSHNRTCTLYGSPDVYDAVEQHKQKPFYAISLPSDSPFPESPSGVASSQQALPELYGSPRQNSCLCTGALHEIGCPSYPGLRLAPSRPSAPATNVDSKNRPDGPSSQIATPGTHRLRRSNQSVQHCSNPQVLGEQATRSLDDGEWIGRDLIPSPLQTRRNG